MKIGDYVRLHGGWTKMTIIGIKGNMAYTTYCLKPTPEMFKDPHYFCDQGSSHGRRIHDFTPWDGHPFARKLDEEPPMTTRYRATFPPFNEGVYVGRSTTNDLLIEDDAGQIHRVDPAAAIEIIPTTFKVKGISSSYTCHYLAPRGTVSKNDLLISDSGNVYVVTDADSNCRNPKGLFKGARLVRESL